MFRVGEVEIQSKTQEQDNVRDVKQVKITMCSKIVPPLDETLVFHSPNAYHSSFGRFVALYCVRFPLKAERFVYAKRKLSQVC